MAETPAQQADTQTETPGAGSTRRTLSTGHLVFMIIAASAPLTVVAGGAPTSYAVTGLTGVPVGYLALGVILVVFAISYGAMSAHIENAGAFYAYVRSGFGVRPGIGTSMLALVSYNAMQIGLYGIFGFALASFVSAKTGLEVPWWAAALVGLAVVAWMGVNKIDLSAKVVGIVVSLEFLIVIVVNIVSFASSPEGVSAEPFAPSSWATNGLGAILAFGIAAFMGFESGAIYSEEVRNPRHSVSRATFIAVAIIAAFYAFSAWALAVGVGISQVVPMAQQFGPDLMFVFLQDQGHALLADLGNVVFITSLFAALMAFHNAAARYFFALGRARVLPSGLARLGRKHRAPVAGSLTQTVLALAFVIIFAIAGRGSELAELFPVATMFTWLTNSAAFGLVLLLCITSLAAIGFFRKDPRGYSALVRVWAPALSALGLAVVFVLIMVNFDVMIGATGPSVLVWLLPAIMIGSGVLGLVWAEILHRTKPELVARLRDAEMG